MPRGLPRFFMIRAVSSVSKRIRQSSRELPSLATLLPRSLCGVCVESFVNKFERFSSTPHRAFSSLLLSNQRLVGEAYPPRLRANPILTIFRNVSTKQRKRWKIRKYHFKLRLKRTMRKKRVPYVSSKARGQMKKKPILYDFRPLLRRKLKRAER